MRLLDVDFDAPTTFASGQHHEVLATLRRTSPVHHEIAPDGSQFWSLTKHADVVDASRDPETFSARRQGVRFVDLDDEPPAMAKVLRQLIINQDPPEHTISRRRVQGLFGSTTVASLEPVLRRRASDIAERMCEGHMIEVVDDVAMDFSLFAISELMGVPVDDRPELHGWAAAVMEAEAGSAAEPDAQQRAAQRRRAGASLSGYAGQLARAKQLQPGSDVTSRVLTADDPTADPVEEFEKLFLILYTGGGFETTQLTITNGVFALLQHPEQLDLLRHDPSLVAGAVEEMLRWATPVHFFRRTATRDVEVRGQQIRSGDRVLLWYLSANRDEDVFAQPERFDIRRAPNPHVSFGGGGPHFCLGAQLARMELRVLFEELLPVLSRLSLEGEPDWIGSPFLGGMSRLSLTLGPTAAP